MSLWASDESVVKALLEAALHGKADAFQLNAEQFEAARGSILVAAGTNTTRLFLVSEGLIGVLARAPDGSRAEAGLVGPGGIAGHMALSGRLNAGADLIVLKTTRGVSVAAAALLRYADRDPAIRAELNERLLARLASTERLCACIAIHSIEQRLARWLLQACRMLDDAHIDITHRELSEIFGVRRASITISLHLLEGAQAIVCRRKRIAIRSWAKLAALSCGCEAGQPGGKDYLVSSSARSTEIPRI